MKKQILTLLMLLFSMLTQAQFDYTPTGRNDVPVLGMQWGLVGGGFTSMLPNRDDLNADQRLDPQMMNFSYGGGIEFVYWFQKTIGIGGQIMYWKGGGTYLGEDTITKAKLSAKTDLTYLKVPVLFHFKSYNRFYPDRRMRFTACFGPYFAYLNSYKDNLTTTYDFPDPIPDIISTVDISAEGYSAKTGTNSPLNAKISGEIYNKYDVGFVVGFGGEARLWRRTVIALQLRADIGITNVENTKGLKITYDNDLTHEYDFAPWKNTYAKYVSPNSLDVALGWAANRPATKNFSVGAFLSLRKYLTY